MTSKKLVHNTLEAINRHSRGSSRRSGAYGRNHDLQRSMEIQSGHNQMMASGEAQL